MTGESQASIGATFELLRRQRQVSYAHVARAGGLRRNTVWTIAKGTSSSISVVTLAKLAVGLATYVYLPGIDKEYLAYALEQLGSAAGVSDLRDEQIRNEVVALLVVLVGDAEAAAAWAALIVSKRELTAEQITDLGVSLTRSAGDPSASE